MNIPELHDWDLSPQEAIALQRHLAEQVIVQDCLPRQVRWVAGVDVSYQRQADWFHGAVVLFDLVTDEIVETATASHQGSFPYVPGLLSFRELPVLLAAFRRLQHRPELILVDGQGIAHPRRFGLASHMGLWLDLPTIGCAKSRLCGEAEPPGEKRGDQSSLMLEGQRLGTVLRTRDRVRPLFISPGHRTSFERAAAVVLQCGRGYRLPEPTRLAHLACNQLRLREEET